MEERPSYLAGIDIFVVSSLSETGPQTGVEAMAAGLPLVTTPVGAMPERISHDEEGLFVPVGDVDGMADAMKKLAVHPEFRKRLGEAARQTYTRKFHSKIRKATLTEIFELPQLPQTSEIESATGSRAALP